MRLTGRDRGSLAVEFALLAPAFIVLMLLLVLGGRVIEAQGQVDGAARDAARAASVQDYSENVGAAIQNAANGDLYNAGHTVCNEAPRGTWIPGNDVVSVTIQCKINVSFFPGLHSMTMTGHAVAPLDTYVERNW
ncbi:MAG: TadE/TadG family type IV pilus assembly protein [Streptosporangiaceae bacterium]